MHGYDMIPPTYFLHEHANSFYLYAGPEIISYHVNRNYEDKKNLHIDKKVINICALNKKDRGN